MPDMRLIGDLDPTELPSDTEGEREELDQQVEAQQPPDHSTEGMSGDELDRTYRHALANELEDFEKEVAATLIEYKRQMLDQRTKLGIDSRHRRELEKFRNKQLPTLDAWGVIDETSDDAHLKAGLSLGLFTDVCTTIPPRFEKYLIPTDRRPYETEARGNRQENQALLDMVQEMLDEQIEESNWRGEIKNALGDLPKHGTGLLRQSWADVIGWERDKRGRWRQVVQRRGMCIKHWDLLNVFVSSPLRKYAWDQDQVIWYSRVTLSDLAAEERVLEAGERVTVDDAGRPVIAPKVRVNGRFYGLERLRRDQQQREATAPLSHDADNAVEGTQGEVEPSGRVTHQQVWDLYELQGYFPIGAMLRTGRLSKRVMDYLGMNMEDESGPLDNEALARMADSVMWYISVIQQPGSDLPIVIEMQPCPYRQQRNELIAGVFVRDVGFYGRSAEAIASDVGDGADKIFNDITDILDNNADPTKVCMNGVFENDKEAGEALNQKGGTIIVKSGQYARAVDAVSYLLKPYDSNLPDLLERMIEIHNTRTMTSQLSKGGQATTESDTLGEAQSQLSHLEDRLISIITELAETTMIRRSIRNLLDDLDWFHSDQELADLARKTAGRFGLKAETILPTAEGESGQRVNLAEQIEVRSIASAAIAKEVAVQFLTRIATEAADMPNLDRTKLYTDAMNLMGLDGERYFLDESGPMSPRDELSMILAGDRPDVNPMEDALGVHMPAHMQQLQMLMLQRSEYELRGDSTEAVDGWLEVLQEHLLETQELAAQQMLQAQMLADQAAAEGQGAGSSGGKKIGGGGDKANQPADGNRVQSNVQNQAKKTPPRSEPA